ncbi:MAG: hypothetical protein AAF985_13950, partial [Bacteroidota bacterium]
MAEGQYIVEGYYGATFCYSELDTVTIKRSTKPEFYVWLDSAAQTNCKTPNGYAAAFAYTQTENGTFPADTTNKPLDTLLVADGYTVTWTLDGDLSNSPIATGDTLRYTHGTYRYEITNQSTGCTRSGLVTIVDSTSVDDTSININVTHITTCGGMGEIAASMGADSTTVDYNFYWYDGDSEKPSPDAEGPTYTVNQPGFYTVKVENDSTLCSVLMNSILVQDKSIPPVLTASATQPNTTCGANPTGIAEVVIGDPNAFDYTWFVGANTLPENEIPDPGNNPAAFGAGAWEMVNLSAGVYTIIGEEIATNCTDTTTVTIVDDITESFLTIDTDDLTPNTSCGVPNGRIDAGSGVTPASGYTFSLYSGFTVDASLFIESNSTGMFEGLAGGDYTVLAVDAATDCPTDPVTVVIDDEPDDPIITTTPTPDEFCLNGNGQILVTAQSNAEPGAYTFEIFDGFSFDNEITSISDITVSTGSTGHTFTGLQDGNYRIRVTNDNLKCSAFEDVIVDEVSELPTFTANRLINPNSSCDPAHPNGNITIEIDEISFNPSDYTWEWYQGSTADSNNLLSNDQLGEGANVSIDGYVITDNVLDGLPAGDYTVFARDNETGCKTVDLTLTVVDDPNELDITTTLITPQTFCSEGNASISASVDGTALNLGCTECVGNDGFSFEWYFGNDTSNPLDDNDVGGNGTLDFNADNSQVNGLIAGDYTVLAREISTQCFNTQTITVNTNFNIPDPGAIATPNTVCDDASPGINFDGTLTVTAIDDNGPIDFASGNFEVTLYEGIGTSGLLITQNNGSFTQLKDGPYTVVVSNTLSGCSSNQEVYTVGQDLDDFSGDINTSILPQISCNLSSPTGQISANVGGTTSDYTFTLLLTGNTINSNSTGSFDSLSSGSYRLVVTSKLSGCAYDTYLDVLPEQVDPVISNQNTNPSLRCTSPNGSLSFDVNAGTGADSRAGANYRADLFEGSGISLSSSPIESATQTGPSASFTFSGLADGNYIVSVTDLTTGCEVISDVFTITYDGPTIEIDESSIAKGFPTDCFDLDGSIDLSSAIKVNNPVVGTNISVEWYVGGDTLPDNEIALGVGPFLNTTIQDGTGNVATTNPAGTVSATGLILDEVPAINYTALIRLDNGCVEILNLSIPEADPPTVTFTPTNPTDCDPSNGSLQINIVTNAITIGDSAKHYQFTLFSGIKNIEPDANQSAPFDPPIGDGDIIGLTNFNNGTTTDPEEDSVTINSLESGTYTVIVRRDPASPISSDGCPVAVLTFSLEEPPAPVLSNLNKTNNTNCADGADGGIEYNGSFSLTATYDGNPEDFNFEFFLFDGANYTSIANGATNVNGDEDFEVNIALDAINVDGINDDIRIDGLGELPNGLSFAIVAESLSSDGCQDTVLFDIFNDPQVISVTGTVENIGDCTPGNGGFIVSSVSPDNVGDYEFTWLDDPALTGIEITTTDSSKLDYTTEGDYYVIARNTLNGCETRLDFAIEDITEDPVIVITEDAFDTHCDPTTGTGGLSVSVSNAGGGFDALDYTFTWYQGSSTDVDSLLADPETGEGNNVSADGYTIGGVNGEVISGLPNGFYTVEVTDGATFIDCNSFLISDISEIQEIPLLSISGIEVNPDSLCDVPTSGQFVIDDSDITPGSISDYTITVSSGSVNGLDMGSGTFVSGSPSTLTFNNLESGSYFISAINNATGCSIAPVRIEIEDLSRLPLITLERLVPDQNCGVLATNAGEIEVLADGFDHTDS